MTSTRPRGLSDLNPDLLQGHARRGLLADLLTRARAAIQGVHNAALCQALSEAYRDRDAARTRVVELDKELLREQARTQEAIRLREKAAEAATDLRAALDREQQEYFRLRQAASAALDWFDNMFAPGALALVLAQTLRTALRRSERGGPREVGRPQGEPWPGSQEVG